jgi:hypothetical protein
MLETVEALQGPKGEGPCNWPGCSAPWDQVDHIAPRALFPELADEPNNWQGLCAAHNAMKGDGRAHYVEPAPSSPSSRAWFS